MNARSYRFGAGIRKHLTKCQVQCKIGNMRNISNAVDAKVGRLNSREYRLYHYTKRCWQLQAILNDHGFWPRFCAEDYSWMTGGDPYYLMVPMACFCDIPAGLSGEHQRAYGSFAIGMSKDWGKKNGLTPVLYLCENGPLVQVFRPFVRSISKVKLNASEFGSLWGLLPYLKPVTGFFPDGDYSGRHYTGTKDFDEEMEWRFIPPAFHDSIYSVQLFEGKEKNEAKQNSEQTRSSMLRFSEGDVETIIVPTDVERKCILDCFPVYIGRVKTWAEFGLDERVEPCDAPNEDSAGALQKLAALGEVPGQRVAGCSSRRFS